MLLWPWVRRLITNIYVNFIQLSFSRKLPVCSVCAFNVLLVNWPLIYIYHTRDFFCFLLYSYTKLKKFLSQFTLARLKSMLSLLPTARFLLRLFSVFILIICIYYPFCSENSDFDIHYYIIILMIGNSNNEEHNNFCINLVKSVKSN